MYQLMKHTGIFGCDKFRTYSTSRAYSLRTSPTLVETSVLPPSLVVGRDFKWHHYLAAWEQVYLQGEFRDFDFVVKVDSSTVFFPERLRIALATAERGTPLYVQTLTHTVAERSGSHAAVQILSPAAVNRYGQNRLRNAVRCMVELPSATLAEAIYTHECLDLLKVGHVEKLGLIGSTSDCASSGYIAFGPIARTEDFQVCMDEAMIV